MVVCWKIFEGYHPLFFLFLEIPNTMWLEKFEEHVENLTSNGHEQIIMGDFNIDQLKTSTFKRSMETFGLEQNYQGTHPSYKRLQYAN
jgi:exonuclease III